jgi:hypothetical protein
MGDVMTIEKQIARIQRDIYWNDQVSRRTKNKTQRNRCIERIERFHNELLELKCKLGEMDIERGTIESNAWYDTRHELT